LAQRSAGKGPRSWPLQMLTVFQSRFALRALLRTK
jgi:hypothetical protein